MAKKNDLATISLPYNSSHFIETWDKYEKYRREILLKPFKTNRGRQSQLDFLGGFDEKTAILIMEQSIHFEWIGLFPLKANFIDIYKAKNGIQNEQQFNKFSDNSKQVLRDDVLNAFFKPKGQ